MFEAEPLPAKFFFMEFNNLIPELEVSNFETSFNFYTQTLGFHLEYERKEDRFAFLSLHGSQLMIEQDNGNWATGALQFPRGRGINFQFYVPSLELLLAKLKTAGVLLFREPTEQWRKTIKGKAGQREFLVQDPDGYLLRFCKKL